MPDPTTTYKNLAIPTPGTDSATWGGSLNNNTFTPIDVMLGGSEAISLSSTNYTLTSSDIQFLVIKLTGTLLTNVSVFSANVGFYVVENNTSGNFTVTWQAVTSTSFPSSGSTVGSGIVIGQGSRNFFLSDQAVGLRRADTSLLPSGTVETFYNASAPVGYTQVVTLNDFAMRIVSGTGGVSHSGGGFFGGSTDGHSITQAELPNCNFPVTDLGHAHTVNGAIQQGDNHPGGAGFPDATNATLTTSTNTTGISVSSGGSGTPHEHTLSGLSMIDLILCTKN